MTEINEPTSDTPATVTGIDDGTVREYCLSIARLIDDTAHYAPHEPGGEIKEIDEAFSSAIFSAPLSYTHQLIGYYLNGVRDGLFALSQMFSQHAHSHIPAAVLTRQIVEYSASAYYLCDPHDSREMRIAKMLSMYKKGLLQKHLPAPGVHELYVAVNRVLNDWHSGASLPTPSPPFGSITKAVASLLTDFTHEAVAEGSYRRLSGLAHASPRDLTSLYELMWRDSKQMQAVHYAATVGDIAVALRSSFAAMTRAYSVRSVPSELDQRLLQIKLQHFGLMIDELTARLGKFWKVDAPRLTTDAYASRGMQPPDLSDLAAQPSMP
ncbi:hypothetical protein ACNQVK_24950 [Mycobacterium sp. 134]|uniref:hypothetical protein n=1 Tax=Mycobacterium sp. 134 TaxID=3400425 RepID=UPI003AAE1994